MKAVIQRVKKASVTINNEVYSEINNGLLILYGVEKDDEPQKLDWMANKILNLRVFEDENEKMNKSVADISGDMLVVSQFTLAADCKKGTRPSFDNAESPKIAQVIYEKFVSKLKESGLEVKTGVFGAMMDVSLVNDGPVTLILEK